jgi:excisionase family DNA binding protein
MESRMTDPDQRRGGTTLPRYHAIKTVADALDVSPRTIRRWIADGDLTVHRVNGVVRIAEADLRAFLALHRES